jgi:microcystin-dependent protein
MLLPKFLSFFKINKMYIKIFLKYHVMPNIVTGFRSTINNTLQDLGDIFANISFTTSHTSLSTYVDTIPIIPSGTIVSYLGTVDVSGWIMCDGQSRINTNRKYNTLYSMGVGSISGSYYTPPDLRNLFLRGASTDASTLVNRSIGNNTVTLTESNIPSHSHSGNTNASTSLLSLSDPGHIHNMYNTGNMYAPQGGGNRFLGLRSAVTISTVPNTTGMSIVDPGHSHSFTTNTTGNGTSFSIVPKSYCVNYLIKI